MSLWKVILATLVIYTAGLFTGAVAVRWTTDGDRPARLPRAPSGQLSPPNFMREEFVRRMADEVKLSPQQKDRILKAVRESQERVRELYSLIGPEVSEEMQYVREAIRAELRPDQIYRYDEFMRKLQRRKQDPGRDRPRPPGGPPAPGNRAPPKGSPAVSDRPSPGAEDRRPPSVPGPAPIENPRQSP